MRRHAIIAAAALALPALAAAQEEAPSAAGLPAATYAAHLAVWADKCGLDADRLEEAVAALAPEDQEIFEETVVSYREEIAGAECTEGRRSETAELIEEFVAAAGTGR